VSAHRGTDVVSVEDRDLARENERFRREVRILKEERDIPKKSPPVLREPKAVRFRFVEEQRGAFPIDRLCRVMNVSPRGLRAFRKRPSSIRSDSNRQSGRPRRTGAAALAQPEAGPVTLCRLPYRLVIPFHLYGPTRKITDRAAEPA
jgi:hypothetical protein